MADVVLMRVDPVVAEDDCKIKGNKGRTVAKRFVATFVIPVERKGKGTRGRRLVRFGSAGGSTYIDHGNDRLRRNYLARHGAPASREDWDDPYTPGALSRWILWEAPSLDAAVETYRSRFGFGYLPSERQ